jgi:GT2 family glycosyltransferase
MAISISVVVPTWNRRQTLEHALPALASQTFDHGAYEILLCDAGSTDGTRELIDRLGIPNLSTITVPNLGRASARNAGIRQARGDIVLFTDADILADSRLVAEHAFAHERHRRAAIVGWEVQVASLDEYRRAMADPAARSRLHAPRERALSWIFFLTGNASVRRDAVLDAGLFDETFTAYGHEDLELGYRLRRKGVRILYQPRAVNYHWHPESLDDRLAKKRLSGAATIRLYRKHRDWRILARLGVNPFSLGWHALLPESGSVIRACHTRAPRSRLCRSIVLEHAYLSGVVEAMGDERGTSRDAGRP